MQEFDPYLVIFILSAVLFRMKD